MAGGLQPGPVTECCSIRYSARKLDKPEILFPSESGGTQQTVAHCLLLYVKAAPGNKRKIYTLLVKDDSAFFFLSPSLKEKKIKRNELVRVRVSSF